MKSHQVLLLLKRSQSCAFTPRLGKYLPQRKEILEHKSALILPFQFVLTVQFPAHLDVLFREKCNSKVKWNEVVSCALKITEFNFFLLLILFSWYRSIYTRSQVFYDCDFNLIIHKVSIHFTPNITQLLSASKQCSEYFSPGFEMFFGWGWVGDSSKTKGSHAYLLEAEVFYS